MTYLLCRPDRVGDVIIATSCLAEIRRQQPEARIYFMAREAMRPLFEGHDALAGFVALGQTSPAADVAVFQHPDAEAERGAKEAGVARRIGYAHGWRSRFWLTERLVDHRLEGGQHEALSNFDLLAPLGIVKPNLAALRYDVHLPEEARVRARAKLEEAGWRGEPFTVLNPTAFSLINRWPPAAFAEFAREMGGRFAVVAQDAQDPSARELCRLLGPEVIDLAGKMDLAELGWVLRAARLLVSRNTGTTHLAAAVRCPTVELFGRGEGAYGATRWRALGEGIAVVEGRPGKRRLGETKRAYWRRGHEAIAVEDVLAAAREIDARKIARDAF